MIAQSISAARRLTIAVLAVALLCVLPIANMAQSAGAGPEYGIAAKRPVVQASCRHCPWGQLAEILQKAMMPAYDLAICWGCSGENSVRYVSKRLVGPEVSDRLVGQGVTYRPDGPIDFGITQTERVRWAYEGGEAYKKEGPIKNLRMIAHIENPAYLMVAVTKSSGITDLHQVREKKMPVRIMMGPSPDMMWALLGHYGITEKDVKDWGGQVLAGNALAKNPNFDIIIGVGVLSNYPEGNMWYEMSQKKDLVFLQIPQDLLEKLAKDYVGELVDLPFRYLRGVDDEPHPTVGLSGLAVYGRDDLPDDFVRDIAKALDDRHDLLKWTNQPMSYDPRTVGDGHGVPMHPAAARYYSERGYTK
jgi:hypothetical protein